MLEAAGFGDLQPELATLARADQWDQMASLIDAEVFALFAVIGAPEEMPALARAQLSPVVTRVSSYLGWPVTDPDRLREMLSRFHEAVPV